MSMEIRRLRSTDELVRIEGAPARMWRGVTASGVPIDVYITRIAVPTGTPDALVAEFDRELRETEEPLIERVEPGS